MLEAIYFWFKGHVCYKNDSCCECGMGQGGWAGVESSARKPVNKKPEEFCSGDLQKVSPVLIRSRR